MKPIQTPRRPVAKSVGGVEFADPYAWLGQDTDEVLAWERRQDALAQETARRSPRYESLVEAIEPRMRDAFAGYLGAKAFVAGRWFWLRPGWLPDGSGFYLHGRTSTGEHELRFHPVPAGSAAPAADVLDTIPATALAVTPQVSPGGRHVVAVTVPHEHVAAAVAELPDGRWRRFAPEGFTGELHGDWLDDDTYVAIATDEPRGRVVAIPAATSADPRTWRELIPAGPLVLRSLQIVRGLLVVATLNDVSLDVRVHRPDGTPIGTAPLPPASASMGLTGPGRVKPRTDELVFSAGTFTTSDITYRLDVATAGLQELERGDSLDGITTEQFFATSKDGTRIPYYVVAREDVDRSAPQATLVTAYGGFNIPWLPGFLAGNTPFVQAGGVYVQANLRGGSEYGRDWYDAGRLHHKQNVFDDLRAVAEDLIARGIAAPQTLAFHGRSNGGLLAGVAAVQQPDLWRVVVPEVPVLDVLEPLAEGPGAEAIRAIYAEDYGDPQDSDDAAVLFSYSPCHNVAEGVPYPAVYAIFGRHDIGCPPSAGRRFVAALQHATTSDRPLRLRVWEDVGHGSLDPRIAARQQAEWLAFVMDELGNSTPVSFR
ncbi:prolyl oligopeptidase family serine peptidase [Nonomuraea sp. NPDC049480]|uniref:prolyl oligopeptidase family serine peptidase n=1 Tax=Nonomuraea sp. NPDC049480 TaxID=3364353 RepID=UPI0037B74219